MSTNGGCALLSLQYLHQHIIYVGVIIENQVRLRKGTQVYCTHLANLEVSTVPGEEDK
jgi:hypothetical protein